MEKLAEPNKKSEITQVLPSSLIEALQSAPLNEVIRTQVHARTLVPIPEDRKTFEEIKQWIEINVEPSKVPLKSKPQRHDVAIEVGMYYSEMERGQVDYSWRRDATTSAQITVAEMQEFVTASSNLGNVLSYVRDSATDDVHEMELETERDEDGPNYDEYEASDYDDQTASMRAPHAVEQAIRDWIVMNMPEHVERLGL